MTGAEPPKHPEDLEFWGADRFLVPARDPEAAAFFLGRLFVSHGIRERLARAVLARGSVPHAHTIVFNRGRWRIASGAERLYPTSSSTGKGETGDWGSAVALLREFLDHADLLEAAGLSGDGLDRCILHQDYAGEARGRVLVFPFSESGTLPAAVVKLRDLGRPGLALRAEWEALQWVRPRLSGSSLAETVPEPLAFVETSSAEILVISHLNGRSAYWDQQNRLNPARMTGVHMAAAGHWLARFHRILGLDPSSKSKVSQGDFWARNLLLGPGRGEKGEPDTMVVDWEHFQREGPPHQDLFHFPITYAKNQPGRWYHRPSLPDAFSRAFLERTGLSRAVETYFSRYCAIAELAPLDLEPLLRDYLRAQEGCRETGEAADWMECITLLDGSQSVLSRCDR